MPHDPPNVLFIIDDQHRYDWLGCAGASFIGTPHIDRLAASGRRFTHCFTNSPVCGPTRCSLASGLLPSRTGCISNDTAYLPISLPNFYRHFRDHGYRVGLVGRHDLAKGGAPASVHGNRPLNFSYGFTDAFEIEGAMAMSKLDEPNGPYGAYLRQHGLFAEYCRDYRARVAKQWILGASHDSVLPAEHHHDTFVGRCACERLATMEGDYPWFMFVSFQGPHDPFDPPAEYGERYRAAALPDPVDDDLTGKPGRVIGRYNTCSPDWPHPERPPRHLVDEARRQYAAKITLIDAQVGAILGALGRRDDADRTIVVFCSDHGEMAGDHGLWQKHVAYEPSWRVPMMIAGPGVEPGDSDALIELSDLNPTLVELAGLPAQAGLDARSFAPVVRGDAGAHRDAVVTMERGYGAIRTRDAKLIMTENEPAELYDLAADPHELHNRADAEPDAVRELTRRYRSRLQEGGWRR